jgi:hypothetical protein
LGSGQRREDDKSRADSELGLVDGERTLALWLYIPQELCRGRFGSESAALNGERTWVPNAETEPDLPGEDSLTEDSIIFNIF